MHSEPPAAPSWGHHAHEPYPDGVPSETPGTECGRFRVAPGQSPNRMSIGVGRPTPPTQHVRAIYRVSRSGRSVEVREREIGNAT